MRNPTCRFLLPPGPLALAVGVLFLAAPARGQDSLRKELAEVAKSVQKQLEQFDESAVAIGPFTGPENVPVNAGPGIGQALREELTGLGVKVSPAARLTVNGSYEDAKDKKTRRVFIELTARLVDKGGKTLVVLGARGVFGEEAVAAVLGATAFVPPDTDPKDREAVLVDRIDEPKVYLDGSSVFPAKASPYGIEVLVKQGDRYNPPKPEVRDGLAYVPLKRDDVYAVRLINNTAHEAAVTLSIDGLNVFAFSTLRDPKKGTPLLSTFVVPAKSTVTVKGWPIDLGRSDEFLVTDYAQSAAAELKVGTAKLGVIHAGFAACWPKDGPVPPDEPAGGKAANATGRGAPIETPFKTVERKFGVLRASVSVRYNR